MFANIPGTLPEERFEELMRGGPFRLERIISTGQITREGQWYDQEHDEWVLVLRGLPDCNSTANRNRSNCGQAILF